MAEEVVEETLRKVQRPPQAVQRSPRLRVVQQLRERDQGISDSELDDVGVGDDAWARIL